MTSMLFQSTYAMVFVVTHKPFVFSLHINEFQLKRVTNITLHHLWVTNVHCYTIIHHKKMQKVDDWWLKYHKLQLVTNFGSIVSQVASWSTFDASHYLSSILDWLKINVIFWTSHETTIVTSWVALETIATCCMALLDAIDVNILTIVLSIVVYKKKGRHRNSKIQQQPIHHQGLLEIVVAWCKTC